MAVAACGGGDNDLPVATQLLIVAATDGQSAPARTRLAEALAVVARASDGAVVPRAEVAWTVTEGAGATLSSARSVADGNGRAVVSLTLGPATGTYRVRAALTNSESSALTLTATATPRPQLVSVTPTPLRGGDTLNASGSGFTAESRVEVGGATARVVDVAATGDALRAIAPACLVPGNVGVRIRVGQAVTDSVIVAYEASGAPIRLAQGDYLSIDPAALGGCATFPDAGVDSVEYLFAPQSVTGAPDVTAQFLLRGDSATMAITVGMRATQPSSAAGRFHEFLRERERELSLEPRVRAFEPPAAPAAPAGINVGDSKTFRVCNKINCREIADFPQITATAKYVGEHVAIFLDNAAPQDGLSDADFTTTGQFFDQELYEVVTRNFGAESDVDRNGILFVLMTPVVNALTPKDQCETSFITGFFFALDVDPSDPDDARSNKAEIFYSLAADPNGSVTCTHSATRIRRLVPVTFVHELQHMTSYNQHVLVHNGRSEVVWLNEAMSHLSEELTGLHFGGQGIDSLLTRFAVNDLFNAFEYLKDPGAHFLVFSRGTGTLEERGSGWLFLRYLVDQHGTGVTRRLSETNLVGSENVVSAVGEPFATLAARWMLGNYVSDLPNFTAPPELRLTTWSLRQTYSNLHEQAPDVFDRPFPIEPLRFVGGTFEANGTIRSGSGTYFLVLQKPMQRGFTFEFTGPTGEPLPASAVARLNVIRVK